MKGSENNRQCERPDKRGRKRQSHPVAEIDSDKSRPHQHECPDMAARPPVIRDWSSRRAGFGFACHSARCSDATLGGLLFTAAFGGAEFLDGLFDRFTSLAGALLNTAKQFVVLALDVLEIVIRKFGPLLLQLALCDVPIALDFECVHIDFLIFRL
jgi:hypothetical protein